MKHIPGTSGANRFTLFLAAAMLLVFSPVTPSMADPSSTGASGGTTTQTG